MASGINDTFRQVGIAIGIAAWGAIFLGRGASKVQELAAGTPAATGAARASWWRRCRPGTPRQAVASVPAGRRAGVADAAREGFLAGFNEILMLGGIVAVAGALVVPVADPRGRHRARRPRSRSSRWCVERAGARARGRLRERRFSVLLPAPIDSSVNGVGNIRRRRLRRSEEEGEAFVKICVLVKEVPDAAVEKRMDPGSKRLDRSGETTLNPFDTHAIEAAMQIREGGAVEVDEIVAVTMGPESRPFRALQQGRVARRRPLGAPDRRRARRLGRGRHRLRAGEGARVRVARPGAARPAVGRRRVLHDRRGRGRPPEDAVADPGDQDRRRGRQAPLRAPGRVRLRHRRGRAARRHLRRRRHQRAALPVAQGDHGREEEAARHEVGRRRRHRGRQGRRAGLAHRGPRRSTRRRRRPPARSSRTRTRTRPSRRSSPGSRKGSCSHERPRLRTSLRGRVQQELARRRLARARSSPRSSAARPPRSSSAATTSPTTSAPRSASTACRRSTARRARRASRSRSSTRWRRSSRTTATSTRCSAAACSASRSAPGSPRGCAPA